MFLAYVNVDRLTNFISKKARFSHPITLLSSSLLDELKKETSIAGIKLVNSAFKIKNTHLTDA